MAFFFHAARSQRNRYRKKYKVSALGADGEMLENAVLYARIILLALPFNVLQLLFQSFCVTAEKPRLGLTVTVMSGVTNMVMDAVLVMLLPQEYKLAGAAAGRASSPRCSARARTVG